MTSNEPQVQKAKTFFALLGKLIGLTLLVSCLFVPPSLIIAAGAVFPLYVENVRRSGGDTETLRLLEQCIPFDAALLTVVFNAIFLICVIVVTLTVLKILIDLFRSTSNSIEARLIGLAFATIILPNGISALAACPLRVLEKALSLWDSLQNNVRGLAFITNYGIQFFDRALVVTNQVSYSVIQLVSAPLNIGPIPDLIFAIAIWYGIARLIAADSMIAADATKGGDSRFHSTLQSLWSGLKPNAQRNLILAGFLLGAGYLSIAAIVTIPWLTEEPTNALNLEKFAKAVDVVASDEKPDTVTSAPIAKDGFADVDKKVESLNSRTVEFAKKAGQVKTSGDAANYVTKTIQDLQKDVTSIKGQRDSALARWQQLKQTADDRTSRGREALVTAYEGALPSLHDEKERSHFFNDLLEWYRTQNRSMTRGMSDAQEDLQSVDRNNIQAYSNYCDSLDTWLNQQDTWLEQLKEAHIQSMSAGPGLTGAILATYPSLWPDRYLQETSAQPQPPEPGQTWGIFGIFARWLLRANSFSLALITGMLGFGLMGACLSFIVRNRKPTAASTGWSTDVLFVVVRGFSAAVVIFLAVMGGLTVFTSGSARPNPYVMFLACLVGAVFSEIVWSWAQRWLQEQLSKIGLNDQEKDGDADESQPEEANDKVTGKGEEKEDGQSKKTD